MLKPFIYFLLFAATLTAQSRNPIVGLGGIAHETNTFNPHKTTLEDFEKGLRGARGILRGQEILDEHTGGTDTTAGHIEGARQYGLDLYPTILAGPQTIGTVTDEAFNILTQELIERLQAAPKLDGILLYLHGTMVVESYPHADAEVVRRVRKAFGKAIPIVVTHDFHSNISREIVEEATAVIPYKQNPHLDAKERGIYSARILADTISGKVKPVSAIEKPPLFYNLVFQNTYEEPLKPIVDETRRMERENPKILAASVTGGYQWSDIPAMGPSVVVITDNDPELARSEAKRLAGMLMAVRDQLVLKLPGPAEAVRMAMASDKFPVSFMDTGDNIGGGSSGDSTFILDELLKQKAAGWVVVIADQEANEAAFAVGVNGKFDMLVGGKTDDMHGKPLRIRGRVKSLHDGRFVEPEVRHGGGLFWDMGLTSVIEVEGSTRDLSNILMLTSKRVIPFSLNQLISCGVYPERQKILVAKGTIAPLAAYQPVSAKVITVDSPGVTAVSPKHFTYKHARPELVGR
ncbi:MAG: M81 family metallopeptidase [Acidobacteria bacterium]|nr:M81 family metallopeptidase [Acidobacteriota bacterium]